MSETAHPVVGLGYIRVESAQIEGWNAFGAEVLGAQPSQEGDQLWLRLDDRPYRMIVEPGPRERLRSIGWEARDAETLERIEAKLTSADFDPSERAFYYPRAIEIATPRWSTYDAKRLGIEAPAPRSIQERAIGSSIWFEPPG